MSRQFNVTAGDVEYATATVNETSGQGIVGTTFDVGVGTYDTRPATWTAGVTIGTPTGSSTKVALLIGPGGYTTLGTKRSLWVKVTDSPEHFAVRVGGSFDII